MGDVVSMGAEIEGAIPRIYLSRKVVVDWFIHNDIDRDIDHY